MRIRGRETAVDDDRVAMAFRTYLEARHADAVAALAAGTDGATSVAATSTADSVPELSGDDDVLGNEHGREVEERIDATPDDVGSDRRHRGRGGRRWPGSITVDVVDLYGHDPSLVAALFASPAGTLRTATAVLRELVGGDRPVQLRLERHPHLVPVGSIGARDVHELVTVEGRVRAVSSRGLAAAVAAFRCPACGRRRRRHQLGTGFAAPEGCDGCDRQGPPAFEPSRSTFVDREAVTFGAPGGDRDEPRRGGTADRGTIAAHLVGEHVGRLSPGRRCYLTGVVRVHRRDRSNRFDLALDVVGVSEEFDEPSDLDVKAVLDAHWEGATSAGGAT